MVAINGQSIVNQRLSYVIAQFGSTTKTKLSFAPFSYRAEGCSTSSTRSRSATCLSEGGGSNEVRSLGSSFVPPGYSCQQHPRHQQFQSKSQHRKKTPAVRCVDGVIMSSKFYFVTDVTQNTIHTAYSLHSRKYRLASGFVRNAMWQK